MNYYKKNLIKKIYKIIIYNFNKFNKIMNKNYKIKNKKTKI